MEFELSSDHPTANTFWDKTISVRIVLHLSMLESVGKEQGYCMLKPRIWSLS